MNYYSDRSSQWKMFLKIDVPKKINKIIKNHKCMNPFFGYRTVKNLKF